MNRKTVLMALAGLAMASSAVAQATDSSKAYAAEMTADAAERTSLLAAGGSGHDGVFHIADGSGNYRLNISGYTQFRYDMNWRDGGVGGGDSGFSNGFELTRTNMYFSGNVINPNTTFLIQTGFDSAGEFSLIDAYGKYQFDNGMGLIWGQFRAPVYREVLVAPEKQLAADVSVTGFAFDPDRTQGIALDYRSDSFGIVGSFNDGANSDNTAFNTINGVNGNEADWGLTVRLEGKFAGDWSRFDDFTSFRNQDFAAMVGGAFHYQSFGRTGNGTTTSQTEGSGYNYTIDASLEGNGWNFFASFLGANLDVDGQDSRDDYAFVIQGGVFVTDSLEVFARWDSLFPDDEGPGRSKTLDDDFNTITFGVNNYFVPESHAAKLTIDASYFIDTADTNALAASAVNNTNVGLLPSTEDGQFNIRVQMQLMF
jgi:hypothetical protein